MEKLMANRESSSIQQHTLEGRKGTLSMRVLLQISTRPSHQGPGTYFFSFCQS